MTKEKSDAALMSTDTKPNDVKEDSKEATAVIGQEIPVDNQAAATQPMAA